jgi:outer membrane protein
MIKITLAAAFAIISPLTALAGGFDMADDPVAMAPAPVVVSSPDLIFRLGGGLGYGSSYFGSDSNELTPSGSFDFQFLRGPGGMALGSETGAPQFGFAPRGSFRVIGERSASDHPELTGLQDVPLSIEVGFGLGYVSQNFEAFADVRYGAIGHHAFVGELGADVVMRPTDRLTLTAGPRLVLGSNKFNDTYFGVTAAEAAASGSARTAYNPGSGAVSVGLELGASYALNDKWNLDGALRYDRFRGDAKNSPIVTQGSDDNVRVTIGVSRLISLDF